MSVLDNEIVFETKDLRIHAVRDDGSELPIVKGVDIQIPRGSVVALGEVAASEVGPS